MSIFRQIAPIKHDDYPSVNFTKKAGHVRVDARQKHYIVGVYIQVKYEVLKRSACKVQNRKRTDQITNETVVNIDNKIYISV